MQRHSTVKPAALAALSGVVIGTLAATASASIVYDRTAAVRYGYRYANYVVSDGYFWINGSTANYYGAGQPVPVNVPNEAGGIGDDCAHFVSSVIGTPGGGLTIPSRAGTYGEPGAARLDELLVGNSSGGYGSTYKYGELVSSVSQLTPGDVIGYDWNGNGGGSMSGIDHTVVYLGNSVIAAHSTSHDGVAWNWANSSSTITFFIHMTVPDSIVPTAPSNVSPAANTSVSNLTPILTANAFSDGAIGSSQTAAQWLIYNGSAIVYNSGTDTSHLTSMIVPTGMLSVGATYTWKVRYQDNYGGWSSYSTPTSLITIIPGDYNHDGVVDTADYVVWRKGLGTTYQPSDYQACAQTSATRSPAARRYSPPSRFPSLCLNHPRRSAFPVCCFFSRGAMGAAKNPWSSELRSTGIDDQNSFLVYPRYSADLKLMGTLIAGSVRMPRSDSCPGAEDAGCRGRDAWRARICKAARWILFGNPILVSAIRQRTPTGSSDRLARRDRAQPMWAAAGRRGPDRFRRLSSSDAAQARPPQRDFALRRQGPEHPGCCRRNRPHPMCGEGDRHILLRRLHKMSQSPTVLG